MYYVLYTVTFDLSARYSAVHRNNGQRKKCRDEKKRKSVPQILRLNDFSDSELFRRSLSLPISFSLVRSHSRSRSFSPLLSISFFFLRIVHWLYTDSISIFPQFFSAAAAAVANLMPGNWISDSSSFPFSVQISAFYFFDRFTLVHSFKITFNDDTHRHRQKMVHQKENKQWKHEGEMIMTMVCVVVLRAEKMKKTIGRKRPVPPVNQWNPSKM